MLGVIMAGFCAWLFGQEWKCPREGARNVSQLSVIRLPIIYKAAIIFFERIQPIHCHSIKGG
jgi:hypothetical protein